MKRILGIVLTIIATVMPAKGISFALDSIAEWGRFPRFCVNTYRWGDKFFNGYDTTYVSGTGYKFNAKIRTESWTDYYNLRFGNGTEMSMISDPSTSVGLYLTYLAVSAGYDMNVSKYLGGSERARKRFNFQFNCMLFAANLYFISNDVGTHITKIRSDGNPTMRPDYDFAGINNREWGIDLSYFFTHKRYSQAAAFNFSRVQLRSGGSFFAGFSFFRQDYKFDFSDLPKQYRTLLPSDWVDYLYNVKTKNYFLKGGYGYNRVFAKHWVLGASISPMIGLSRGYIKYPDDSKTTFSALMIGKTSVVYNHGRWFAGAIASAQGALVRNSRRSIISGMINFEISGGVRFNIW